MSKLALAGARERIGKAMLDLVAAEGYQATTVEAVIVAADVSQGEFDALFPSKEACFKAFFEEMADDFYGTVFSAYESPGAWRDRLRRAAYAAGRWMRDHPKQTRYATVEPMLAGAMAYATRDERLQRCVAMIEDGRKEALASNPELTPTVAAEVVIGSIVQRVMDTLGRGGSLDSDRFVPEFMSIAVRPYLGEQAAREELSIPPPPEGTYGD